MFIRQLLRNIARGRRYTAKLLILLPLFQPSTLHRTDQVRHSSKMLACRCQLYAGTTFQPQHYCRAFCGLITEFILPKYHLRILLLGLSRLQDFYGLTFFHAYIEAARPPVIVPSVLIAYRSQQPGV